MFRQSYDDEKCKCRACVFFERVIRTFHPRSIFSWTRSNLFIAYYISRNSCHYGGPAEKYRFSFDAIHAHTLPFPLHIPRFISAYSSFIENGFAACLSSSSTRTHGIYNARNAQLQSTWPSIGPASRTEQYFRLVYTTPAARESICRLCTGKYHLALVFRYSILFTIKSVRRHRCVGWPMLRVGACVWAARGQEAGRREDARHGSVFDGARESWVFAAIKRAYLIKPGPELMGQQPLSPLWNARIYQRAEVARTAKDFPIVTGFSEAFSSTEDPRYSDPPTVHHKPRR